jgi:hypothetical protein
MYMAIKETFVIICHWTQMHNASILVMIGAHILSVINVVKFFLTKKLFDQK